MKLTLKTAALWMIPVVVVGPVACSTATQEQRIEDTVTSEMPLSQACGECAETALVTTCKDELETCVNTPSCLDVAGCMDGCAANDVGCFADCAAASAPFGALIDCVLCTECAGECSNDWTCGGQPPNPPVPPGAEACAECITNQSTAECHELAEACLASTDCVQTAQCLASCGLTDACVQQCAGSNTDPATFELLEGLYACATTSPCKAVCIGDPGQPPPPPTPTADCKVCAESAIQSTCGQTTDACLQTAGCAEAVECVTQCQDASCLDSCAQNQSDEAWLAAKELLSCVLCDACLNECGQEACSAI